MGNEKPDTIFQKIADWIEQPEAEWLKNATQDLQNLMVDLAKSAGKAYLRMLAGKIVEQSANDSLTGEQKFANVFNSAIDPNNTVKPAKELGNNELNTLINGIVSMFKLSGTIK